MKRLTDNETILLNNIILNLLDTETEIREKCEEETANIILDAAGRLIRLRNQLRREA